MYGVNWNETTGMPYPNTTYTTSCIYGHYYEQGEFQVTATSQVYFQAEIMNKMYYFINTPILFLNSISEMKKKESTKKD